METKLSVVSRGVRKSFPGTEAEFDRYLERPIEYLNRSVVFKVVIILFNGRNQPYANKSHFLTKKPEWLKFWILFSSRRISSLTFKVLRYALKNSYILGILMSIKTYHINRKMYKS